MIKMKNKLFSVDQENIFHLLFRCAESTATSKVCICLKNYAYRVILLNHFTRITNLCSVCFDFWLT